jgi:ribonuclease J
MTSLQFFGGIGEIGGNKILVEDRELRIWLDFGKSFSYGQKFFINWLTPRRIAGCKDHFEFDLLPKIKGLFSKDKLENTDLKYENPQFQGVFLTHAHFDHIAHIEFIDPTIPIFLGEATYTFINSQETTNSYSNYGSHIYKTFKTGSHLKIDNLEIEPIHVDHSIPAAYGFLVHTSEGTIGYTGDLRLHGPKSQMTKDFIEASQKYKLKCLISEGTRVAPDEKRRNLSEHNVFENILKVVKDSKGLVLGSSYGRYIDRFNTFFNVAIENGRNLVITPKIAYLVKNMKKHMDIPDITKDQKIRVLFKRRKSGKYDDNDYYTWERQFLDRMITSEKIRKEQTKYFLHISFFDFTELIDINPQVGSDFIYSMSEPFTEEDLNYEVMKNWILHFNLKFHQFHASGHASSNEIKSIIEKIAPEKIIPVHTEYPHLFGSMIKNIDVNIPSKKLKLKVN